MQDKQYPNVYYIQDLKYVKMFVPTILNALGIWPSLGKRKSICKRLVDYLFSFLSYSLIFASIIPSSLFWVFKGTTHTRVRMFTPFAYSIVIVSKYSILILSQDQIRRCLKYVEEDWKNVVNNDERNMMLEAARVGRRLVAISMSFYCSSIMSVRLIPLLYLGKIVDQYNVTIRLLPSPAYLFSLDIQATPVYEIMYSLQGAYGIVSASIATGGIGLIIIFVMHACGQLKILMNLMSEFSEDLQQKEVDKKLANIVEHQIRIRNFLQVVDHALRQISFLEISIGSLIMSIQSYCILTEFENSNSMVIIFFTISYCTATISVFIFCYVGNQLILQAEKVALMSYELEWCRLPDRKARQLLLVIIMSNKPMKITAGNFLDLSLKTFGDIMKTSFAYLNMLRNAIG
ncbi:ObirOr5-L7 [Ooceraea biroi]|uniref:Odorant receptor n=1 Tax=Ooceraea biroi TaxID=2015173 RepID=A0A3L8D652_OOCBI|nr:odorant receptor 30a isoform X1 [Ooceraea biroi]RLU15724.1 ObirOr5-L7 [Ooceraea biroi]